MLVIAGARALAGRRVCFVGIGLPNIAVALAQRTVAPEIELIYESGAYGSRPERLPLSIGDPCLVTGATAVMSMIELFQYFLQGGLVDVGFLGAAQLDRYGNINTTVIGDYARPKVRLPGSGGACEIAINAREVFVLMRQSSRSFVERIDFRTSPGNLGGASGRAAKGWQGKGPTVVVTDLGRYDFDPLTGEMRLAAIHPGVSRDHVFGRGQGLPRVVRGRGCELWDAGGRRYLDAAGGAVVVGVGHGVESVADAIRAQAAEVAYAHGTTFTSEALEAYAEELAAVVPVDDARVYPVSGGSEAIETALKMARAYHLARGQDRHVIVGRWGAYHGNTIAALDLGGREPLRAPYRPWLGQARHTLAAYEYRCPFPDTHPRGCGPRYAEALERTILEAGADEVAAFVAEPIAGAALGAAVPPDDYWPAVVEVCRRHGVLVVADEVMTGFGRTGRWFGSDHWGVRPDILVAAKGAASGYWPLGLAVASGRVHETISTRGFTHGFTYSHHLVGAAAGAAVLRVLRERDLVAAAQTQGKRLRTGLQARLDGHP